MNTTAQALQYATALLNCSRVFPPSTIMWIFNGKTLSNSSKYRISRSNQLFIYNVKLSDAGVYYCGMSDDTISAGVILSVQGKHNTLAINFIKILVPPSFLDMHLSNGTVVLGNAIILNCSVFGVPIPVVTWFKDGVNAIDNQYITNIIVENEVVSVLTIRDTKRASYGTYTCQASNDLVEKKSISASAYITIYCELLIVSS